MPDGNATQESKLRYEESEEVRCQLIAVDVVAEFQRADDRRDDGLRAQRIFARKPTVAHVTNNEILNCIQSFYVAEHS